MAITSDPATLFVAVLALFVSVFTAWYQRSSVKFQSFLLFVEKESSYASEFKEQQCSGDTELTKDKFAQYMNLFEALSLSYAEKEVPKKITRKYFRTVLRGTYARHRQAIDSKILEGDYEELNKLLHKWNLK